jgi:hypothetical protein
MEDILNVFKIEAHLSFLPGNYGLASPWHSSAPACCHNPTNNPKQLKTTFVGVVL